jgi:flagellar protein FlbD
MIRVTRLKGAPLVLNSDLIEHVEATPDTVIALTNGQKIMVLETPDEIVQRVVDFRRAVGASLYHDIPQADNAHLFRPSEDGKGQ